MIRFEFHIANNFSTMRHVCIFIKQWNIVFQIILGYINDKSVCLFIVVSRRSTRESFIHMETSPLPANGCKYMYKIMVIEQEGCRQGASLVLWCVTEHVAGVEAGHFFRFSFNFLIFFAFFNLGALFTFRFPFTILRACTITTNRFLFKFC